MTTSFAVKDCTLISKATGKEALNMREFSTREGGGVAEILNWMISLKKELGLETEWEVVTGGKEFYQFTKNFHNGLQGNPVSIPSMPLTAYEQANADNAERARPMMEAADFVFIHDPQPAPLLRICPNRKGRSTG